RFNCVTKQLRAANLDQSTCVTYNFGGHGQQAVRFSLEECRRRQSAPKHHKPGISPEASQRQHSLSHGGARLLRRAEADHVLVVALGLLPGAALPTASNV